MILERVLDYPNLSSDPFIPDKPTQHSYEALILTLKS